MPKPMLKEPYHTLQQEMLETMIAGLHQWRPDLSYPESSSDMIACIFGLFEMFEIKRRPLPLNLADYYDE